jgi:hypothetical protein
MVSSLRPRKFSEHGIGRWRTLTFCMSSHSMTKKSVFGVLCQGRASLDCYFLTVLLTRKSTWTFLMNSVLNTLKRKDRAASSSRMGRHATLLRCPCSECMRSSLRNEQQKFVAATFSWPYSLQLFSLGTLEEHSVQNKSAHNTGTEGQYQPCSDCHWYHYFTLDVPKHD